MVRGFDLEPIELPKIYAWCHKHSSLIKPLHTVQKSKMAQAMMRSISHFIIHQYGSIGRKASRIPAQAFELLSPKLETLYNVCVRLIVQCGGGGETRNIRRAIIKFFIVAI